MAIRFKRRAKIFPGVWINFGKTGISTTVGFRGLNVNLSKRGTYLNTGIPGTGISSRVRIDKTSETVEQPNPAKDKNEPFESPSQNAQDDDAIHSGDTQSITSEGLLSLKETLLEAHAERETLNEELKAAESSLSMAKRLRLICRIPIVGFFIPWFTTNVNDKNNQVDELKLQLKDCRIHVDIAADPTFLSAYDALLKSFNEFTDCQFKWGILSESSVDRAGTRSSASVALKRRVINIDLEQSPIVKADKQGFHIETANINNLYFYPGFIVLIDKINNFGLIDLNELQIGYSSIRFLEEDIIPKDSEQVDTTWQKVNKNGTPDKRFKGNRQIPIMQYGELSLKSGSGLNEMFMFSNYKTSLIFTNQLQNFIKILSFGKQ